MLLSLLMQITELNTKDGVASFNVAADESELLSLKQITLTKLQPMVKTAGFRSGKVPTSLVEKNVDQQTLQSEFLEDSIGQIYSKAVALKNLRPVANPKISILKFVPFTTLEIGVEVEVIGDIKLPDYKKIKKEYPKVTVSVGDENDVLSNLKKRMSEKKDVDRAAKIGDQVWIDFKGADPKTNEPVKGADGENYPLILGSKTFIPGFEDNLVDLKAKQNKEFTLTFPKDYGFKALAGSKVKFSVNLTKVQEVIEPKLDDAFAAKAGPFKSLDKLKEDIKTQLTAEKTNQARQEFESQLVKEISDKTKVVIPEVLTKNQVDRMIQEVKQNLSYRGKTYEEMLEAEGISDDEYQKELSPRAEEYVKASIVLAEIAQTESIQVSTEELNERIEGLKKQYTDGKMRLELEKPAAQRDIKARMLSEKTLATLTEYATKKN